MHAGVVNALFLVTALQLRAWRQWHRYDRWTCFERNSWQSRTEGSTARDWLWISSADVHWGRPRIIYYYQLISHSIILDFWYQYKHHVSTKRANYNVLALPLEIWSDRLSRQRTTDILMNHWIATNTTGSYCLKNRRTQEVTSRLHYILETSA